jgi:hypothetical protein
MRCTEEGREGGRTGSVNGWLNDRRKREGEETREGGGKEGVKEKGKDRGLYVCCHAS